MKPDTVRKLLFQEAGLDKFSSSFFAESASTVVESVQGLVRIIGERNIAALDQLPDEVQTRALNLADDLALLLIDHCPEHAEDSEGAADALINRWEP